MFWPCLGRGRGRTHCWNSSDSYNPGHHSGVTGSCLSCVLLNTDLVSSVQRDEVFPFSVLPPERPALSRLCSTTKESSLALQNPFLRAWPAWWPRGSPSAAPCLEATVFPPSSSTLQVHHNDVQQKVLMSRHFQWLSFMCKPFACITDAIQNSDHILPNRSVRRLLK